MKLYLEICKSIFIIAGMFIFALSVSILDGDFGDQAMQSILVSMILFGGAEVCRQFQKPRRR